jgi:T5SS/PEP-CTERM-associated repeat protein
MKPFPKRFPMVRKAACPIRPALFFAVLCFLILPLGVQAQDVSITGEVTPSPASSPTWDGGSDLSVGDLGTGTLTITGSGSVSNNAGVIGLTAGSSGTATVMSGTWANSGDLTVGRADTGTLEIAGSGVVSVGGTVNIADQAFSTGTLNLNGGVLR